jgi:hypothetical protein
MTRTGLGGHSRGASAAATYGVGLTREMRDGSHATKPRACHRELRDHRRAGRDVALPGSECRVLCASDEVLAGEHVLAFAVNTRGAPVAMTALDLAGRSRPCRPPSSRPVRLGARPTERTKSARSSEARVRTEAWATGMTAN